MLALARNINKLLFKSNINNFMISGNFVEDKSPKMETLNESDGAVHGMTIWTVAGWSRVILTLLILVCAVMYFKKSIE